jgi:hypothetical protein
MSYVIPYFKNESPNWIHLNIFLCEGGRSVWSLDGPVKAMLADNGFPVLSLKQVDQTIYAEIDRESLKLSDFYQWTVIDPATSPSDVWRTLSIPTALWSCPVFKEHFWAEAGLPIDISNSGLV